jgi:hypothetical protein
MNDNRPVRMVDTDHAAFHLTLLVFVHPSVLPDKLPLGNAFLDSRSLPSSCDSRTRRFPHLFTAGGSALAIASSGLCEEKCVIVNVRRGVATSSA